MDGMAKQDRKMLENEEIEAQTLAESGSRSKITRDKITI